MDSPDQEPDESFWQRHRFTMGAAVVVLIVVGVAVKFFSEAKAPVRAERKIQMVTLAPPPPPPPAPTPPPPPPPPEPPRQEMVKQETVSVDEPKPEDKPEPAKAADEPPAALGTNLQGDGPPDGFGLAAGGNNFGGGTGTGIGGGPARKAGSKWGWYAGLVQTQIGDALRKHTKTRTADLQLKLRLWSDASGRIERVALVGSSGNAELDRSIENDVLTGIRLSEPPPADMPMPIVMRITARRPN